MRRPRIILVAPEHKCTPSRSRVWLPWRAPSGPRRPRATVAAGAAALAFIALLGISPARAYVRARTDDTGRAYFWHDPRNILELATPPDGIGISAEEFRAAATRALAAWSQPAVSCTVVSSQLSEATVENQEAKRDGHNRVVMRTGAWCRDPVQMTDCHDPAELALTTWFVRSHPGLADDGQILEADIEINTIDHSFSIIPDPPFSARDYADSYDLISVLTHEAGHFIGLAHNCRGPNDPLLLDDQGVLSPECSSPEAQSASILGAVMYPMMNPIDVHQRILTADDLAAACTIYPLGSLPNDDWKGELSCSVADRGRQETGGDDADPLRLGGIATLLALSMKARRRRRASGSPVA